MSAAEDILAAAKTILVIDWPSRDVPDALARASFDVIVKGGPGPADYTPARPARVDIVYCHRPLAELPAIVELAQELGAGTIWYQSGLAPTGAKDPHGCWLGGADAAEARATVEDAGLRWIAGSYIADVARRVRGEA